VGGEAQRITQFRAIAERLEMPQRRVYLLCLLVKWAFAVFSVIRHMTYPTSMTYPWSNE
jgi:hypothetical protein